ncbi:MAG: type II toxin-antitoxin system PemK/MazF family toxin [Candidatus Binatia bacterium]
MIGRGDIRWFRFDRPDKRRPVLVVGRPDLLRNWSLVPVIPLSSQIRGLSWELQLGRDDGLPGSCVLKPEWIRSVRREELGPWLAQLPGDKWPDVMRIVVDVLGLSLA